MAAYLPRFIEVPDNLTMGEVERAIVICMQLGLLDNRRGYVIIPPGISTHVPWERGEALEIQRG